MTRHFAPSPTVAAMGLTTGTRIQGELVYAAGSLVDYAGSVLAGGESFCPLMHAFDRNFDGIPVGVYALFTPEYESGRLSKLTSLLRDQCRAIGYVIAYEATTDGRRDIIVTVGGSVSGDSIAAGWQIAITANGTRTIRNRPLFAELYTNAAAPQYASMFDGLDGLLGGPVLRTFR